MTKQLTVQRQILVVLLSGVLTAGAWAQSPPEVDRDGLHLVHHSDVREVYARPGVDFSQFGKVILVDAYVAFRKNWGRDQNRGADPFKVSKRGVESIKQRVGDEFHKAFVKELEKKGIPVVGATETGQDVLIVRPAIINLDVTAPDTMEPGERTIAASAGQMTLYAELYDSVSSQLIGRVVDPRADHGFGGQFMAQNRVTNKAAEDKIVKIWADALAGHLLHVTTN